MVHASSAVIDGKAVLFAGESGKGKSTIVKKLNCRILANDRSILRFEKGTPRIFCSPFYEQDDFPKVNNSFPLSAIYLLEKKKTDKINLVRLDEDEAIFRLIPQIVIREDGPGLQIDRQTELAFASVEKLAKKISVYTLSYPLNKFSVLKRMLNENNF
jgi:energy-coupling factor transporter ATP-binding protein EcfA2